jgi:NADH-quinone oxidoreductase subunit L
MSSTGALLWLTPLLPAVVGALLCLVRPASARLVVAVSLTVAAILVGLAILLALTDPSVQAPFMLGTAFGLAVDPLAAVTLLVVTAVTLPVLSFASADVRDAPARFHGLMLIFVAAVLVTVTATTLPTLLLAWEVMGATSYALIGFAWREPAKLSAGLVAFVTTRTADLGLYVAAGAALAGGGDLSLAALPHLEGPWLTVAAVGVAVAALGKAAQLPFAFWLSGAMEGPSPVSALLHAAAMVAMGGYLLLRVSDLLIAVPTVAGAVAWVGAGTAVLLGLVAVAQRDLKQLLAASTSAQLGFVVLAAGVGGVTAGLTQLTAHAATKALLFLVAGAWLTALGTKQLSALRGVARRWRAVGALATVGVLGLAGIAPLALWASKEAVLAAVLAAGPALYWVGLVAAALSAAYAGKVLAIIWAPTPDDAEAGFDGEEPGTRQIPVVAIPPLLALALGAAGLGVLVLPAVASPLRSALADPTRASVSLLELVGSSALAVAVVLLVWWRPQPEPTWARHWLGLEWFARTVVVVPVDRLARALARFDDRVIDRAVEKSAAGTLALARRLRTVDEAAVDGVVGGIARGATSLGRWASRPQTGQIHQYYLQSAAVLAALVIVLVMAR